MTTKTMMQAQCEAAGVPLTVRQRAQALADKTSDAYSFGRYASWTAVAEGLLRAGYSERQAEAIMRSKWTRWAADAGEKPYGRATYKDLKKFMGLLVNLDECVEMLVRETNFGE